MSEVGCPQRRKRTRGARIRSPAEPRVKRPQPEEVVEWRNRAQGASTLESRSQKSLLPAPPPTDYTPFRGALNPPRLVSAHTQTRTDKRTLAKRAELVSPRVVVRVWSVRFLCVLGGAAFFLALREIGEISETHAQTRPDPKVKGPGGGLVTLAVHLPPSPRLLLLR